MKLNFCPSREVMDKWFAEAEAQRYTKQDYVAAFQGFEKLASFGHKTAQFELARMYHYGLGVSEDLKKAFKWYREAACKNEPHSCKIVADCYFCGDLGVEINEKEAFYWYRQAAKHAEGLAMSKREMGYELFSIISQCYLYGIGTDVSSTDAEVWKRKADACKRRDYYSTKPLPDFDIRLYQHHYSPQSVPGDAVASATEQQQKWTDKHRDVASAFVGVFAILAIIGGVVSIGIVGGNWMPAGLIALLLLVWSWCSFRDYSTKNSSKKPKRSAFASFISHISILIVVAVLVWILSILLPQDAPHHTGYEEDPPNPFENY